MNFLRRIQREVHSFFPGSVPPWMLPTVVHAELLPDVSRSGLDLYRLVKPLFVLINTVACGAPVGETVDFGSIPRPMHWFAWPTELALRAVYAKHDIGYTLQGGRRYYKAEPDYTRALNLRPQSRLRLDYELMRDIVVAKMTGRWNPFRGLLSPLPVSKKWWVALWRIARVPRRLAYVLWHPLRALLIFAGVVSFGWLAWRTIEPETETYS